MQISVTSIFIIAIFVHNVYSDYNKLCEFAEIENPYFHSIKSLLQNENNYLQLEHLGIPINKNIENNWNDYKKWLNNYIEIHNKKYNNFTYEYKTFYFIRHAQFR